MYIDTTRTAWGHVVNKACNDATSIKSSVVVSAEECLNRCKDIQACTAAMYRSSDKSCWLESKCEELFDHADTEIYIKPIIGT